MKSCTMNITANFNLESEEALHYHKEFITLDISKMDEEISVKET